MPPRPALLPNFPPRQPGETPYQYRNRRSIALYGQTLYERRIASGRARGINQREAAGHAPVAGRTEYQIRAERTQARYGLSPTQLYYRRIDDEMDQAGFSPELTGLSRTALRRIWPRLKWINSNTSPGGELSPGMLAQTRTGELEGDFPRGWTVDHVNQRYESMYEFKVERQNQTGNFYWFREYKPNYEDELPANWWYYH